MKNTKYLIFFMIISIYTSCNKPNNNEVYFIPTLHGTHTVNPNYSYDSLKAIITRINPDIIAVEIRSIDLSQDSLYLSKSYPYEMINARNWFPNTTIEGFDWLGEDIEGKLIPDDYWQKNPIKQLQAQLDNDSIYKDELALCNYRLKERIDIINSHSLQQLLQSKDEEIVKEYYNCVNSKFRDTPYEPIFNFYKERDRHILYNIRGIIKKHNNSRIVILTGDDHYQMLKDSINHLSIYKN